MAHAYGRSRNPVTIANERVSLVELLGVLGHDCPYPPEGRSVKIHCPFGFEHSDHGNEAAFRVYSGNTGFCFAGHGFMTPVWLAAQSWDVEPAEAAQRLLNHIGYVDVSDVDLVRELLEAPPELVDKDALGAALRVWCERQDDWRQFEYSEPVTKAIDQLWSLLPRVSCASEAARWLDVGKIVMARVMGMVSSR